MEIRGVGVDFRSALPISEVRRIQSTVPKEASAKELSKSEIPSDSVSLSFIDKVSGINKENPRVQEIKSQIASGTYKIPSGAAILDKVPQFANIL